MPSAAALTAANTIDVRWRSLASTLRPSSARRMRSSAERRSLATRAGERAAAAAEACTSTAVTTAASSDRSCSSMYSATCASRGVMRTGVTMKRSTLAPTAASESRRKIHRDESL